MLAISRFGLALLALFAIPLAAGALIPARAMSWPVRWWVSVTGIGLFFAVAHALGAPLATTALLLGVAALAAFLLQPGRCLLRLRGICRWPDKFHQVALLALLLVLLGGFMRVMSKPVPLSDGKVIWLNKAKALYAEVPFAQVPAVNYPNLGPMLWMLVMKLSGGTEECFGRLFFPTQYFFWMLGMIWLHRRRHTWVMPLSVSLVAWLFFSNGVINGYQDMFLLACAGMSAAHFVKLLLRNGSARGERHNRRDRADYFCAFYFAGVGGFIKNEGAVLGMIIVLAWVLALAASQGFRALPAALRRAWPALLLWAVMLCLWPMLLLHNEIDLAAVQRDAFSLKAIHTIPQDLHRWRAITPHVLKHFAVNSPVIFASVLLSVACARAMPRVRQAVLFLWLACFGHMTFVILVFFVTRQDVAWHLGTAFERLALQHAFVYAIILCITPAFLAETLRVPEKP